MVGVDLGAFGGALFIMVACSAVLSLACESFDLASSYLGRHLPPGVRGATINAVGSSMPELLTTSFFLFYYDDLDGFAAGVATCAGSAVFNAVIIPALCIGAAMFVGVGPAGRRERVDAIRVSRQTILRDGLFYVFALVVMIALLGMERLSWKMGAVMASIYLLYITYIIWQVRRWRGPGAPEDDEGDGEDDEDDSEKSLWLGVLTLDVNRVLFGGRPLNTTRAWVVLLVATGLITAACEELAAAVMNASVALDVPAYFTAVISVPDTILSVRDALSGDYDDAVANAFGSNIFDITVALGLPLFLYGLIHGPVTVDLGGGTHVQDLQIGLLVVTLAVMAIFLIGRTLGRGKTVALFGLYAAWMLFILAGV
jgi:cation:H+ antiporter